MLVLTRSLKQKIYIEHKNEVLEIIVVKVSGKQVSIGFKGSKEFNIKRDNIKKI